jgi:hypothetical protein
VANQQIVNQMHEYARNRIQLFAKTETFSAGGTIPGSRGGKEGERGREWEGKGQDEEI